MKAIIVETAQQEEIIDITRHVMNIVHSEGWRNGALHLFCRHTTCGLTINESADPDVRHDLIAFFRKVAPRNDSWRHAEGNTDAHIRSSLLGVSLLVPIESGTLLLGTWQAIYLYEGDGPRKRTILCQLLQ